jgi:hypothetical protein
MATAGALVDNIVGANPNEAPHATRKFPLGMKVRDINGNEYAYVKFGGTVAQYEAATNAFALLAYSTVIATASGTDASQFGVNNQNSTSATSGKFGWVQTKGIVRVKVASSLAIKTVMVPASTAGTLTQLTVTTTDPTLAEIRAAFLSNSGMRAVCLTTEGTPTTGQSYALVY